MTELTNSQQEWREETRAIQAKLRANIEEKMEIARLSHKKRVDEYFEKKYRQYSEQDLADLENAVTGGKAFQGYVIQPVTDLVNGVA